jgi:glycosyltransferase involved in cell wall biosynthesis
MVNPRLSICIATYNRGKFIGDTLDSILGQMTPEIELVVVDGASADETPSVMASYLRSNPGIRYFREQINSGVDQDYDKAVGYATGEYCWLMTDDDLLLPSAVTRVLDALRDGVELVVLNSEVRNHDFSVVLESRLLSTDCDRAYGRSERDRFFANVGSYLSFIGGVIVKRQFWLDRNRTFYYGSLFVHFGVIFQCPALRAATVISDPLIQIRYGNAMWTERRFEIWMFKWPDLVWSTDDVSDEAKRLVSPRYPYLSGRKLLFYRAVGCYSGRTYRKYLSPTLRGYEALKSYAIARFPARLANVIASVYCVLNPDHTKTGMYDLVHSPHSSWVTRRIARAMGVVRG